MGKSINHCLASHKFEYLSLWIWNDKVFWNAINGV